MKIGIDLDGVLAKLLPAIIEYHNFTYKTELAQKQFNSYGFWKTWGGTRDEAIQKLRDFYQTNYFKNIKPVSGAIKALSTLKQNNDLFVITARPNEVIRDTKKWLNQYYPNFFSGTYFANHCSQSGSEIPKSQICDDLAVELMIEDSIENALDCISPKRRVFLFDRPWNQQAELPPEIKRVFSWKEILKDI